MIKVPHLCQYHIILSSQTNRTFFHLFSKHIGDLKFDFVQTCVEAYHSSQNGGANTSCSSDEELDADRQQPEIDKSV